MANLIRGALSRRTIIGSREHGHHGQDGSRGRGDGLSVPILSEPSSSSSTISSLSSLSLAEGDHHGGFFTGPSHHPAIQTMARPATTGGSDVHVSLVSSSSSSSLRSKQHGHQSKSRRPESMGGRGGATSSSSESNIETTTHFGNHHDVSSSPIRRCLPRDGIDASDGGARRIIQSPNATEPYIFRGGFRIPSRQPTIGHIAHAYR
jgi:hypothetical protein